MHLVRLRPLFAAVSIAFAALSSGSLQADESPPPASAASPAAAIEAPPAPRFDITEFKVEGDTILGAKKIDELVKPFTGKSKDFGDVQQALEALQDAYQALGFSAVRVNLPEQELESGVVHFVIVEQKIGTIKVEGNEHYTEEAVLRAVPALQPGTNPNTKEIGKSLKISNENPTKQTAVLFTDNEQDSSKVDAIVKVLDDKPWKAFVTLDNTGSRETGWGRVSFGYQNFNMFDTDQRLTAQFVTNPHYPQNLIDPDHKVYIVALAYTIPLASIGDSIDLIGSYSDTTSSEPVTLSGLLGAISGKGLVLGAHYNHTLPKLTDYEQRITFGYDNRATRASSAALLGPLTPGVTTTPISFTYAGQWTPNQQNISFTAGIAHNIVGIAGHGDKEDFVAAGPNADSNFTKLNFTLEYLVPLPKDWQIHAAFSSQMSWDHLVSIEKFRVGGADSVRGFHESELSGDEGFRASIEAISSDFGKVINAQTTVRGVIFADAGRVSDNADSTGIAPVSQSSIASIGVGLRYNYGKSVVGRFDLATVINGDTENGVGNNKIGDHYGHFSIGYVW